MICFSRSKHNITLIKPYYILCIVIPKIWLTRNFWGGKFNLYSPLIIDIISLYYPLLYSTETKKANQQKLLVYGTWEFLLSMVNLDKIKIKLGRISTPNSHKTG